MSDDAKAALTTAPVLFEHYCEYPGCKAWGGLGYDLGAGKTEWRCYAHKREDYRFMGSSGR